MHSQYRDWLQKKADAGIQRTLASSSVSATRTERRALALAMSAMRCCTKSSLETSRTETDERDRVGAGRDSESHTDWASRNGKREELVGERLHDPRPVPHLSPLLASPHHNYVNVANLSSVPPSPSPHAASAAAVDCTGVEQEATSIAASRSGLMPVKLRRALAVEERRSFDRDEMGDEVLTSASFAVTPQGALREESPNRMRVVEPLSSQKGTLQTGGIVSSISQPNLSSANARALRTCRAVQAPMVIPEDLSTCICDRNSNTQLLLGGNEQPNVIQTSGRRPDVLSQNALMPVHSLQNQLMQTDLELSMMCARGVCTDNEVCTCRRELRCPSKSPSTLRLIPIEMDRSPLQSPGANHVPLSLSISRGHTLQSNQNLHDPGPWRQVGAEAETELDSNSCYIRANSRTSATERHVSRESGVGHVRQGRRWRALRASSAEQEDRAAEVHDDGENSSISSDCCCRSCVCWTCSRCVLFCKSGTTNGSTGCACRRARGRVYIPIPASMEWQTVAKIMDRAFLFVFLLTTLLVWAVFMIYGFNRLHDFDDPAGDFERLQRKKREQ